MKKMFSIWLLIVFGLILLLTACGEKSQEDVLKKLEDKVDSMNGYKAKAEMKMNTGQDSQKYKIDIWHKKKEYYRVSLKNDQDEKGSQIILKNKDGVFVLTPALNKSFKFQTNWPDNSSQPYLFQSLVHDIKQDKDAEFKVSDSHYIFQTKTNYQSNNNLPYQEIYFDKKTYSPVLVKVLDKDKNALVEVNFSKFDMKPSFKDDDFAMEKNMTSGHAEASAAKNENADPLTVVFPLYMAGAELAEQKEVETDNGKRVIMTYTGEKNFTLIEEKKDAVSTLSSPQEVKGDIVNLGHSIGALSENAIEWSSNGVNFYLASEDLTKEELIEIAKSVQGKAVK
ncbi:outer membrane lipoprotein carrier protein LolA [Virgibacillus dakarensis]|uniref:Sporulation protein YdcC n=1 Tax=Lentibacillus populi TaxID=1827502 RepID=A0A9W5U110_9BACI|nr:MULTISPECIES: outer membrane lipoprotein carrier protein LolA [Bacillaceae]MBT2218313.1 outer membrane lipoprotein carrier protein LolA [Virgibacillus dakarensis]MTW85689.1 outer membrane lipoprotein carrier protein LolA [Virgibacillus dakarensis]GGB55551.1 sporulation protein YdcC [Lentibacillus populi]